MPRGGFRDIFRALWRRGREVFSPASRRSVPPRASAWARGRWGREVCSPASRQGAPPRASGWSRGGRVAKFSSVRVGGRGRAPAGEGAEAHDLQPGEVFGVSVWAKARWPEWPAGPQPGVVAITSSARVGVGEGLVACSSINFGRPGALLGSSVAFGSGCGEALPGVPRKAPLC